VKNSLAKKVFGRVSIAHGLIILLTILMSSFRGCTPKPEVITFVDLAGGPASAPMSEPESEEAPEPAPEIKAEPEQKPTPKPKPKPEKKPALKPIVTNTPPQKVETNTPPKKAESKKPAVTNVPSKKAETKPKTLEERLKEVRLGGKPVAAPKTKPGTSSRPAVDYSGLRNALNSAAASSGSGRGGSSSSGSGSGSGGGMRGPFDEYYDSVKQQMYAVWQQPAGAPIGLTAEATIRVERNGTVSLKSITRRSGNGPFDQSVQGALNATSRLPVPPADLPDLNIRIMFELSD